MILPSRPTESHIEQDSDYFFVCILLSYLKIFRKMFRNTQVVCATTFIVQIFINYNRVHYNRALASITQLIIALVNEWYVANSSIFKSWLRILF